MLTVFPSWREISNTDFPWNSSSAKVDLYITSLTTPYMIWLSIKTLVSKTSMLLLAHSPPCHTVLSVFPWIYQVMFPVQSLPMNCSLHLECSLSEPHIYVPHFLQAFSQTSSSRRAPDDAVEMSMWPIPHALPQLYLPSSMCHHPKHNFIYSFCC